MQGLMQDYPLTLPHIFARAELLFPDKVIVTALPGGRERITYGAWAERTRRLGGVLDTLGISADGRVATFSWNTSRHLELYFAAPCTGRVLHTLNLRLFPEQVTYIVNHAEDEVIFVDKTVAGLLWPLLGDFSTVRHIVVIDDGGPFDTSTVPDGMEVHDYEDLLAAASPVQWHVEDEGQAETQPPDLRRGDPCGGQHRGVPVVADRPAGPPEGRGARQVGRARGARRRQLRRGPADPAPGP